MSICMSCGRTNIPPGQDLCIYCRTNEVSEDNKKNSLMNDDFYDPETTDEEPEEEVEE